jgi:exodeoxyribonuclease X
MNDIFIDVFDTETASLQGGVCQIAIARINTNFEVVWQAESLIDPERPIEPGASGIHHITDDMVKDSPTLGEFMAMHNRPFHRDRLIVAGHNTAFDIRMVAGHLPQQYLKLCTLKLARNVWPTAPDHKLQTLRYMLKLDAGEAHSAMGDVIACISLMKAACRLKNWNLLDLIASSNQPLSLDSTMPFGKHKGQRLRDVPKSWMAWALKEMKDLDPDLRAAFQKLVTA